MPQFHVFVELRPRHAALAARSTNTARSCVWSLWGSLPVTVAQHSLPQPCLHVLRSIVLECGGANCHVEARDGVVERHVECTGWVAHGGRQLPNALLDTLPVDGRFPFRQRSGNASLACPIRADFNPAGQQICELVRHVRPNRLKGQHGRHPFVQYCVAAFEGASDETIALAEGSVSEIVSALLKQ